MPTSNIGSSPSGDLAQDPRELAHFHSARISEAEHRAESVAAVEEEGSASEPACRSAHLRAEAAAKRRLLEIHPGAGDRGGFCPGCVAPHDVAPRYDGHCHVQLVLARIWQDHPDFPAWVLSERVTGSMP
ncbi:hypothetical protein ACFTXJ_15260 [Streptomyces zhihengii]|uniref:hypothetical protein n=1 Tax=Streptomyces zhihengii TaxID=1818004 RepID=UPI00363E6386